MLVFQKWNRNGLPFKAKLQCIGLHLRHICLTSIVLQRPRVSLVWLNIRRHQETAVSTGALFMSPNLDVMVAPIGWDSCDLLWSAGICWAFLSDWPLEHTQKNTGTGSRLDRWIFKGLHCHKKSVQQNPKLDPTCPGKIDNHIHSQAIKTNQSSLSPLFANDVTQLLLYVVISWFSWFSCHYVLVLSTMPLSRWNHVKKTGKVSCPWQATSSFESRSFGITPKLVGIYP